MVENLALVWNISDEWFEMKIYNKIPLFFKMRATNVQIVIEGSHTEAAYFPIY